MQSVKIKNKEEVTILKHKDTKWCDIRDIRDIPMNEHMKSERVVTKTLESVELVTVLEEIVFSEAEDSDSKRENANVDGNSPMGMMLQMGSTASKEVARKLVEPEALFAHNNGDIHIHDLDFYSTGTATCTQIDLKKLFAKGFNTGHGFVREPQKIETYANLSAIAIQANQNDQHGGQSIPAYDYYMSGGVLKTYKTRFRTNLSKFLEILGDLSETRREMHVNSILSKLGEIESIEFDEKTMKEFKDIVTNEFILMNMNYYVMDEAHKDVKRLIDFVVSRSLQETEDATQQAMEAFVHNLNTMHSRAGAQVPFSSVNFGTDTSLEGRMITKYLLKSIEAGLGNGETAIFPIAIFKVKDGVSFKEGDPNYDLFQLAIRVSSKRLFPNFSFIDAPHNLQFYEEGNIDSEISYMGCRTRTIANRHGKNEVTGRGNVSFTSVNLPRLGIKHRINLNVEETNKEREERINSYMGELRTYTELAAKQIYERYLFQAKKKVKNFPFLMGQGIWAGSDYLNPEDTLENVLKEGSLTIGFIGLAESLVALTGKHHGECEESQKLGLKIIEKMKEIVDESSKNYDMNYALIATPAEGLSGRFTEMDKEKYGEIEGVTDREYYTNSFHVPVYFPTNAFHKITIEAPYHALTTGGHISYVEVDGDMSKNLEAFESIIIAMKNAGIGYGSINHPVDRDSVCGFSGVIGETCPNCGRSEEDEVELKSGQKGKVSFDRIRRITGYLVGTVDRFNDSKTAEEKDRIKHI